MFQATSRASRTLHRPVAGSRRTPRQPGLWSDTPHGNQVGRVFVFRVGTGPCEDWQMADGDQKIFTLSGNSNTESTFDIALRGYDRKQVDRFVLQVEGQVAALAAQREDALVQAQALAAEVQQIKAEMIDLRRRTVAERPSFKHLGARAEQILALVEEEAEEIRSGADAEAATLRSRLDKIESERRSVIDAELAQKTAQAEQVTRDAEQRSVAIRTQADRHAATVRAEADRHAERVKSQ